MNRAIPLAVLLLILATPSSFGVAPSFQGLGNLGFNSFANGVSSDGSVVVGRGNSPSEGFGDVFEAFHWTSGSGMVGLGHLAGSSFNSTAFGVSSDGSVVVGSDSSGSGTEAFRWTIGSGMVGLGDLSGGFPFSSQASGVSSDGSVVVGVSDTGSVGEAFRWTSGSGMVGLGALPDGNFQSDAFGVSADGSVVVGESSSASGQNAFIWDTSNGMRSLHDILVNNLGLDLTDWTLSTATGISADGFTIVGFGTNPSGDIEAWRAVIPEPSSLSLLALGSLTLLRRRRGAYSAESSTARQT